MSNPSHLSEYTVRFKDPENPLRRPMIKPPQKSVTHAAKMASDTTTGQEFVAYPITPPAKKSPILYQPPEKEMESATEYKNMFLGKWQAPVKPITPSVSKKDNVEPFNHSTTQATDFLGAPPVTPRQIYGAKHDYEPPKTPFGDVSTTHVDFVGYGKVPVTPSLAPTLQVEDKSQPIEGVTSYRSTFTKPTMPEKFQRQKTVYMPSSEKVSDFTTSRYSFPKYPFSKPREMIKHTDDHHDKSHVPLESSTINRLHFKTWDIPKKFSRPPTAFIPPTEKVSDQTTFRSNFPDYGCVPLAKSFKPVHKGDTEVVPFISATTQNADYKAWNGVKRPEPARQDQPYEPPKEKFDPTTTFTAHYKGTTTSRASSIKPVERPPDVSKMDFTTSYKDDFSGPGYKPCPISQLSLDDNKVSKYSFSHEDPYGHKFYKPTKNSKMIKC